MDKCIFKMTTKELEKAIKDLKAENDRIRKSLGIIKTEIFFNK